MKEVKFLFFGLLIFLSSCTKVNVTEGISIYTPITKTVQVSKEGLIGTTVLDNKYFAFLAIDNGKTELGSKVFSLSFQVEDSKEFITEFKESDILDVKTIKTDSSLILSVIKEGIEFKREYLTSKKEITLTQPNQTLTTVDVPNPLKAKLNWIMFLVGLAFTPLMAKFKDSKVLQWIGSTEYKLAITTSIISVIVLMIITGFSKEGLGLFLEIIQSIDFIELLGYSISGSVVAQGKFDLSQIMKTNRDKLDHGV